MSFSIAFSGKGGTGKTTLAGVLVRYLVERGASPVLVVDADSNYNINEVLGVDVPLTVGEVREQMKKGDVPSGMTKDRFMSFKLEETVVETNEYDLVVMGQPEGTGCYCAANTLLSDFLGKLRKNYSYVVMDNEAGMEHISRLTTNNIDRLLIISDPSKRGLQAAARIKQLAENLNIGMQEVYLIVNNLKQPLSQPLLDLIEESGLELLGTIDADSTVEDFDLQGRPTFALPSDNPMLQQAFALFAKIIE